MKIKFESQESYHNMSVVYRVRIIYHTNGRPTVAEVNWSRDTSHLPTFMVGETPDAVVRHLSDALYKELKKTLTDEEILEQLPEIHPPEPLRAIHTGIVPPRVMARHGGPLRAGTIVPVKSFAPEDIEAAKLKIMGMFDPRNAIYSGFGDSPVDASANDSGTCAGEG